MTWPACGGDRRYTRGRAGPGVVVHLTQADPGRQRIVLRNVENLRADLGGDVPIELVAHGAGVELLTGESGLQAELAALLALAVKACACANTLRSRQLEEAALQPGVEVVPSGVGHLARRQLSGWAYLRP